MQLAANDLGHRAQISTKQRKLKHYLTFCCFLSSKNGLLLLLFKYFVSSKHVLDNCAYIANVTVQTDLQTLHLQNYADSFVLITKPQALHLTQQYKYFKAIKTPADGAFE